MMIESLDIAAVRPPAPETGLAKISDPEPSRPVQGTTGSLDSGLDVNRDRYGSEQKVYERESEPDTDAMIYDAKGIPRERRPQNSTSGEVEETVDLFV